MSKIISCSSSAEYPGYPCRNAIDDDLNTCWNSGALAPQSIEVNLDSPVRELTLGWTPEMTPHLGDVSVEFLLINDLGHEIAKYKQLFPCQTGVMEKVCLRAKDYGEKFLGGACNISRIRLTFLSSPSWIALRDIRVL